MFLALPVSGGHGVWHVRRDEQELVPQLFAWVVPLMGGDFAVCQWHHMMMWFFIIFAMIHVYLVCYHDYVEGRGVASSMVGGWKFVAEVAANLSLSWFSLKPFTEDRLLRLRTATVGCVCQRKPDGVQSAPAGSGHRQSAHGRRRGRRACHPAPWKTSSARRSRVARRGTGGFHLLSCLGEHRCVIIIDATMDGSEPGTVRILKPRFLSDYPRSLACPRRRLARPARIGRVLGSLPVIHLITVSIADIRSATIELTPAVQASLGGVVESVHASSARSISRRLTRERSRRRAAGSRERGVLLDASRQFEKVQRLQKNCPLQLEEDSPCERLPEDGQRGNDHGFFTGSLLSFSSRSRASCRI